ncbi:SAM-dependent methyltransferase [Streptacidiphilus sp. ASG 303]|uniref:SAM-dependent methyltransferase n=1 Tax=Streptacidiphilus sp. ASG 303 TaxID=2896847 RepID=UPI001E5CC89F|nr:SAM-dependent methyltransferase [Streptacidiphilus sp. ASG 303]MCD0483487.1 SAM-dependent methyltransferase [Streptacidiphilus sp. ASG 303]
MPDRDPRPTADRRPVGAPPPNIARIYDYLLGGKDHFSSDREVGTLIERNTPEIHMGVKAQRDVLRRVVRHLVAEAGITQLVDIGSGLPSAGNVHEVAHAIDPSVRVAYVDNDPVVLTHARALLADNDRTIVVEGDLRRPAGILADPALRAHIDFGRPVGLLLCGILHYVLDEEDPAGVTRQLYDALAPGSHVFVHHLVANGDDADPDAVSIERALRQSVGRGQFRTLEEIAALLHDLEPVEPGVTLVSRWRPDADTAQLEEHPVLRLAAVAVARKG